MEPQKIDLRPRSKQYPEIDGPAARLVEVLERRGWSAPGVHVEFRTYALGTMVSEVTGEGWRVWYCRVQGGNAQWNDTAAVSEIVIGERALSVYEDWSGPRLAVYVGPRPAPANLSSFSGMNERLHGQPRTVLLYEGSAEPKRGRMYTRQRNPYLAHNNDLERMHDPRDGEPTHYRTADVLREMGQACGEWLACRIDGEARYCDIVRQHLKTLPTAEPAAAPGATP